MDNDTLEIEGPRGTRWECTVCPFTTVWEDAARGHLAGPSTGRGWLGEGEAHSLTLVTPQQAPEEQA